MYETDGCMYVCMSDVLEAEGRNCSMVVFSMCVWFHGPKFQLWSGQAYCGILAG